MIASTKTLIRIFGCKVTLDSVPGFFTKLWRVAGTLLLGPILFPHVPTRVLFIEYVV
jgi:hypothetical protein